MFSIRQLAIDNDTPTVLHMKPRTWLIVLLLITTLAYLRIANHDFVELDDPFVSSNEVIRDGLTWAGFVWSISNTQYYDYWHPLSWLSHMLDFELFGDHPGGHHLSSLFIHLGAVVALFLALRELTGKPWQSICVSAMFALNPVHIESVAWIIERKDVLSTLFFFLTLGAYARFIRLRQLRVLLHVTIYYALGLSAKPMLVTLPFLLI